MAAIRTKPNSEYGVKTGIMEKHHGRATNAFTLLELLLVIAIIAIVAALLVSVLSQGKRRALNLRCVANLHQLGVGLQTFLANDRGYPSRSQSTNADQPGSWMTQLEIGGLGVANPQGNFFVTGIWQCPAVQWYGQHTTDFMSYGYNAYGVLPVGNLTNSPGLLGHLGSGLGFRGIGESEVIAPSDMMAIADCFDGSVYFMRISVTNLLRYGNTLTRHQGRGNVLFCDGHVESPLLNYLMEDRSDVALSRWNRDHQPHHELLTP